MVAHLAIWSLAEQTNTLNSVDKSRVGSGAWRAQSRLGRFGVMAI
jgi:hypothetical protein